MVHPPIQIVDEHDKVIGQMSRDQAWALGHWHRIVRIILFDPNGRLLLQLRSAEVNFPNVWDFSAAGHVDGDEDYLVAAERELYEEIGVKAELKELAYYKSEEYFDDIKLKRFNKIFTANIDYTPENINKREVEKVEWFELTALKDQIAKDPKIFAKGLIKGLEEINL